MNSRRAARSTRRLPSKACNECKQQKLKCSAATDHPQACARCRKLGLVCKVEDGFQRVDKRREVEILHQENAMLRRQLRASQSTPDHCTPDQPSADRSHAQIMGEDTTITLEPGLNLIGSPNMVNDDRDTTFVSPSIVAQQPVIDSSPSWNPSMNAPTNSHSQYPVNAFHTSPRSIGGIEIEPNEIDEMFKLYFTFYSHHLPFLDPNMSPDAYYNRSPLLFWAIIGVGVRRYAGNPTLLHSIAQPILNLAWPPLNPTSAVLPAIQGLLLLSVFPFPADSTAKDSSYTLSGMAISLALQVGLHVPISTQDDSRWRVPVTEENLTRRVKLWAFCIIVHQKAACGLGHPIMFCSEAFLKQIDFRNLSSLVSHNLSMEMRLGSIFGQINNLFLPSFYPNDQEDHMKKHATFLRSVIIDGLESRLDELNMERKLTDLEILDVNFARLQLRTCFLLDQESAETPLGRINLGISATSVIELIEKLDTDTSLALHCPNYVFRMTALAASILLRLCKQPTPNNLSNNRSAQGDTLQSDDYSRYKPYYFRTLSLLKKMSIENNDMPSRMAKVFAQLWSIEKLFQLPASSSVNNGRGLIPKDSLLVTQSRFVMSVFYDCMWRWRHFCASSQNTYIDRPNSNSHQLQSTKSTNTVPTPWTAISSATHAGNESGNMDSDDPLQNLAITTFENLSTYPLLSWGGPDEEFERIYQGFPESWSM